jgi:hypothetical protein
MPEEPIYGEWPASGEIDIMESRGNEVGYEMGGRDIFVSTLHWGMPRTEALGYGQANWQLRSLHEYRCLLQGDSRPRSATD